MLRHEVCKGNIGQVGALISNTCAAAESAFALITLITLIDDMSGLAVNRNGVQFNPDRDIPDLAGKSILVTGGTSVSVRSNRSRTQ